MNVWRRDAGAHTLIFLPGFMSSAQAYSDLLNPVADAGISVIVPQLYRRGVGALMGNAAVADEARKAADLVAEQSGRVIIAGHSRGGQAAWLAAGLAAVAGVCLIDPVDGEGRRPSGPTSTAQPAGFECPALIVGAGVTGACAPRGVNYEQFARVTPQAHVEVITDMGHADMLNGRSRALGRRLCGGGADPDRARAMCARLITEFAVGVLGG